MNENIDLTKILKDCPMFWKFYSSVYGEVEFIEIYNPVLCKIRTREDEWLGQEIHDCNHSVRFWTTNGIEHRVSSRGEMIKGCGECTLFPSRDQRDWSKFTAPWYKKWKFNPKTLKSFDRVLVSYGESNWKCKLFSHIDNNESKYKYDCCDALYEYCIPYNADTKHLVGTTDEAPDYYKYWED